MKLLFCAVLSLAAPALAQVTINGAPTREFGQPTLLNPIVSAAPNLVEGRELYLPSAIAFDTSVNPPRVYIADTGNNRVLSWKNANSLLAGNFADLVLGQLNLQSTLPLGPTTTLRSGLSIPTGVVVDAAGNVYVADSGNNRILRYKTPYQQQAGNLVVDLVIGQKSIAATSSSVPNNQPNQGLGTQNPNSSSVYLSISGSYGVPIAASLAFDAAGNLWVADPGNNRVLRFPVSSLAANPQSPPPADTVLGQNTFGSNQLPGSRSLTNLSFLEAPTGIAFDAQGNLYAADQLARVIQFTNLITGATGSKVLGVPPAPAAGQTIVYPTSSTLGSVTSSGSVPGAPQCVFSANGSIFVCDSYQNRIVRYDSVQVPTGANSPVESGVTGQPDFVSGKANQGNTSPTDQTFSYPVAAAINPSNNEMWVVDQQNHRVVALPSQGGGVYSGASRVVGQLDAFHNGVNLLEGREVWFNSGSGGGAMVVDGNSNPPHLYIADTQNHRVLGFKDARAVGAGSGGVLTQTADLVIGQADLFHNLVDYPNGSLTGSCSGAQPTATGLCQPIGLAVDASGNLWVADSGNGRALRFPAPFSQPAGSIQTANLVLGQADFNSANTSVTQFNMVTPYGLGLLSDGSLAVSDPAANRVLIFSKPSGGDFNNGMPATRVLGQTNFNQASVGGGSSQFNEPLGIAVDTTTADKDSIFVCDYGNNRLMVFPPNATSTAVLASLPNGRPTAVAVSSITGDSWVTSGTTVVQLPAFGTLENTYQLIQQLLLTPNSQAPIVNTLAVALDPFDNVIVADSANRVTFFFPKMYYKNTASFAAGVVSGVEGGATPTMLIELARENSAFTIPPSYTGAATNIAPSWPLSLNGVQVTVAGLAAPIFRIDPGVIFIEVPNAAPTSGTADFIASDPNTGQILAVATIGMQAASPGLYTANAAGYGAVAANNYDSKGIPLSGAAFINGPNTQVSRGGIIGLWLTGAGNVPGLPADGVAPGQVIYTPVTPTVTINGENATVVGSAMSPQYPGLWQVNVIVPSDTAPSSVQPTYVIVQMDLINSNIGGNPGQPNPDGSPLPDRQLLAPNGLLTTIYVK